MAERVATPAEIKAGIQRLNRKGSSKFGNIRTPCKYGHTHASGKEANRCNELNLLALSGQITELQSQPRLVIEVNGVHICTYVPDWTYNEEFIVNGQRMGGIVVEDCKGCRTSIYKMKRLLLFATTGIIIRET